MSATPLALGLDVGGTKLAAGLLDPAGRLIAQQRCPTPREEGPTGVLAALASLARTVLAGHPPMAGAGLSIAGPMDTGRGVVFQLPNLPGWDGFPVRDHLERALSLPVIMENDANAAAVGEYCHGGHGDSTRFLYLTLSTGIGGGFLMDGRLYAGAGGGGGEFGHVNVQPGGYACGCGARGCFEAHCSGTAIARRANETLSHPNPPLDAEGFFARVAVGEPWALILRDAVATDMGRALGTIVNLLGPDRIVLGGGMAHQWPHLETPVMDTLRAHVFAGFLERLTIRVSTAPDDIALVGAATLARQHFGATGATGG